jgi:hypothetical protein
MDSSQRKEYYKVNDFIFSVLEAKKHLNRIQDSSDVINIISCRTLRVAAENLDAMANIVRDLVNKLEGR